MERRKKTVVTVISDVTEHVVSLDACLVVIYGLDLGKRYKLDQPTTVIGRSSKCIIFVDQESISRNHAKLTNKGKSVVVKDLGSTNGTYVNDKVIDEVILKDGDLIKIGRTIFKFISGDNIENAYHEEIFRLTTIDGLTQVFNKRYFMEALEREMSRCHRYGRNLSLILFDIDFFKKINDTHDHLAGDSVLKDLAKLIKGHIRREDILARYGGEEFTIILPEIDNESALVMGEKVRALVAACRFQFQATEIPFTVSVGVAAVDDTVVESTDLIKLADQHLYNAKKGGRNKVCG